MARASSWPPSGLNSSPSFEAGPGLQHVGPVLANSPSCVGHWARQRETGAQRPRGLGLVASPPTASVSLPAERWQVGFITSESEFWPASSVWRRCRQGRVRCTGHVFMTPILPSPPRWTPQGGRWQQRAIKAVERGDGPDCREAQLLVPGDSEHLRVQNGALSWTGRALGSQ